MKICRIETLEELQALRYHLILNGFVNNSIMNYDIEELNHTNQFVVTVDE